jgi:hypothetical protein
MFTINRFISGFVFIHLPGARDLYKTLHKHSIHAVRERALFCFASPDLPNETKITLHWQLSLLCDGDLQCLVVK